MQLIPHQRILRIAIGTFLPWYFREMPVRIINAYCAYTKAFWEIFSFPFLIRTLFSPWKNVLDPYPKNHFDFQAIFQALVMNLISRAIGCTVRLIMMAIGIVVHVCCLAVFLAWLTVWMLYPFLLVLGSLYLLRVLFLYT
ncbi:MAG TPA: hypothetical protein PKV72_03265 [Candidatus Peribacteria bacterium]|nr:hypothetical protein [Candidatus Peribacteria bacterium]